MGALVARHEAAGENMLAAKPEPAQAVCSDPRGAVPLGGSARSPSRSPTVLGTWPAMREPIVIMGLILQER